MPVPSSYQRNKVRIGLKDVYYAILVEDTKDTQSYATPAPLAPAVTATIAPTVNQEKFYADDSVFTTASVFAGAEVELETTELHPDVIRDLLGIAVDSYGVSAFDGKTEPPFVAIMFRSQMSDGMFKYVCLHKGRFALPEDEYATKGESVEFTTTKLTGTFIPTQYQSRWQSVANEGATDPAIISKWFEKPYAFVAKPATTLELTDEDYK